MNPFWGQGSLKTWIIFVSLKFVTVGKHFMF